jgi:hypothetical protein
VFNDEEQWRTPRREAAEGDADGGASGGWKARAKGAAARRCTSPQRHVSLLCWSRAAQLSSRHRRSPVVAPRPAEASRSSSSSAFGGGQFWAALRGVEKLEGEVRALFAGEPRTGLLLVVLHPCSACAISFCFFLYVS